MRGLFKLVDTHGIPLDLVIEQFGKSNMVIDWIDFLESANKCGWKSSTTLNKIEAALCDIKGEEYSKCVITRLQYYINNKQ